MMNSSQISPAQVDNKLETVRNDVDDNQHKLIQCRVSFFTPFVLYSYLMMFVVDISKDAYETEILDFLSKEMSIAQVFYDYVKLQESYHEKMLEQIKNYIPALEGVIGELNIVCFYINLP